MAPPRWSARLAWRSRPGTEPLRGLPQPAAGAGRGSPPRRQAWTLRRSSPCRSRGAAPRWRA